MKYTRKIVGLTIIAYASIFANFWVNDTTNVIAYILIVITISSLVTALVLTIKAWNQQERKEQ